jgi:gliding motility-associated-like protein
MQKSVLIVILSILQFFGLYAQEVHHDHSVYHSFVENKGQWPEQVFFMNRFGSGNMWVENGRILFHIQDYDAVQEQHFNKSSGDSLFYRQEIINLHFEGANKVSDVTKEKATPFYYNYFLGNDQKSWANEVRGYAEFTLHGLYNGIDVRFIEQEKQIKYEFAVEAGANPKDIQLRYGNQKELKIDEQGRLVIKGELGNIIEEKPYAYQILNGKIVEVKCAYQVDGDVVTFALGEYSSRAQLIIDPTLVFATYCGSVSDNFGMTATYGYDGTAYNGGMVYGNDYPTPDPSAYDVNSNMTLPNVGGVTTDAFISKYSPDGTTMLWSTFYGGGDNTQGTEVPKSLICDLSNNIYVYGVTSSLDLPIVGGFQTAHAGGSALTIISNGTNFGNVGTDIFVAKFSENGQNLMGSTYVGGSENDGVSYLVSAGNYANPNAYDSLTTNYGDQFRGEIMLDSANNILVGSCTRSSNFPLQNAFQNVIGGQQDGVLFKLNNDFSSMQWSSFYGGSENDAVYSVKVDSSANVVFAGGTSSSDLSGTFGGYQEVFAGGSTDGFIGKLSPNGQTLSQVTYLGETDYDQVFFVEIDRLDNIFVIGQSNGGNFPVINANYSNANSGQFIAKLDPALTTIIGSTTYGSGSGTFDISPAAFLVDICGNMYVSGWGANILQSNPLSGMPVTSNAFQQTSPNGFDFHLIVIEREFNSLLYGTYMGGSTSQEHVDGGTSRFDKNGVVYQGVCAGCGGNSDFPTTPGAWSSQNLASNCNALVFKFDFNLIPNAEFSVSNAEGCAPFEVTFDNFSSQSDSYIWDFGNGDLDSTTFEPTVEFTDPGTYNVALYVTDSICLITDTAFLTITVYPEITLEDFPTITFCSPEPIEITAESNGTATTFVWSSDANLSDTLNSNLSDSTLLLPSPQDGWYYIEASNQACSLLDSVQVIFTSAGLSLVGDTALCEGDQGVMNASSSISGLTFSNFDWSNDNIIDAGDGTNEVTVSPTNSQYLFLTATASNGCIITDSIFIAVSNINSNTVSASASETQVPIGTTVMLTATPTGGYEYLWLPTSGLSNPNGQTTQATMNQTTMFTLLVTDGICVKQDSVEVKTFEFRCEEPFIFVPNAFTPNGDGENDLLFVRSEIVEEVVFRIYNRWGELVFETTDMNEGWDGSFRGKNLDPDVYDYYVDGFCIDGQNFLIQGNVTLIR